jgi:hypothetical protein
MQNYNKDATGKGALQTAQGHIKILEQSKQIILINKLAALVNLPHKQIFPTFRFATPAYLALQ